MIRVEAQELRDDVLAELDSDPMVDDRHIGVAVEGGAVTLTGTVPTFAQKYAADKAVKRVKGVTAVAQELKIDLPATHQRNDSDIAQAIANALYWDATVPASVKATVQDGYATLTGQVDWNFERVQAESAVRRIKGVRAISNLITLRTFVPQQDIRNEIQRTFHRDAQLDANNIQVIVDGGTVTLKGTVHSWFERGEASRAAWAVKGVTAVNNQISIR